MKHLTIFMDTRAQALELVEAFEDECDGSSNAALTTVGGLWAAQFTPFGDKPEDVFRWAQEAYRAAVGPPTAIAQYKASIIRQMLEKGKDPADFCDVCRIPVELIADLVATVCSQGPGDPADREIMAAMQEKLLARRIDRL